jgi:hypothetical protein
MYKRGEKEQHLLNEIFWSKKQTFQDFLKSLDYKKDSLKVHKFTSTLNNKHDVNNREPINCKDSFKYKDKEVAKAFTSFYTFADHIPKLLKKLEKHMKHTIKEKYGNTDQKNIFNFEFKPYELTQAIACFKTKMNPGPNSIVAEFLKYLGLLALCTCLQLLNHI